MGKSALTYLLALLVVAILAGHHLNASLGSLEPASQKSGPRRQKPSLLIHIMADDTSSDDDEDGVH